MRKILSIIIKICISLVLLVFLFSRIDLKKTLFYIRTADPLYFVCAILLFVLLNIMAIARWMVLLRVYKKDLSLWRAFAASCGGLFFNVFLPSTIGGDIAKVVDLSLHTKDSSSIFASVLLDRIFGFTGLVLVAVFGFSYGYYSGLITDLRLFLFIIIFALLIVFSLFFLFNKKVFGLINKIVRLKLLKIYLEKIHNSCYSFRAKIKVMFWVILLSLLIQAGFSVVFYFTGMSLGINLNIIYYLALVAIISIVTFLPISIGGLGLRDNAAVVLFSAFGVAADRIAAMTLLIFFYVFFIGVVGGIIYAFALYRRRL